MCIGSGAPAEPDAAEPGPASSSPIRSMRCDGSDPLSAWGARLRAGWLPVDARIGARAAAGGITIVHTIGPTGEHRGRRREVELRSLWRDGGPDRRQARGRARKLGSVRGQVLLLVL